LKRSTTSEQDREQTINFPKKEQREMTPTESRKKGGNERKKKLKEEASSCGKKRFAGRKGGDTIRSHEGTQQRKNWY